MNNKMSGDLEKIKITGKYFVEIWKAIGMESIDDKVSIPNCNQPLSTDYACVHCQRLIEHSMLSSAIHSSL